MPIRLAFAGFRHSHIFDLYRRVTEMDTFQVVAACEEDGDTRERIAARESVEITHTDYAEMLATVECDAIAIGDYYARRGHLAIDALQTGRHVIGDKPLCTSLAELDAIECLATEQGLKVGCMLDLRDTAPFIGARTLVRRGLIGEVHAVSFGGQHPLLLGTRAGWYFEPGKHGGTINDIAIHALDAIPWITGLRFQIVNAARCWNALAPQYPHFEDGGQLMLTMDNGCGVIGDVSYFAPDSSGYALPFYWRMTFWGESGVIETSSTAQQIVVALDGEPGLRHEPLPEADPGGYLRSYLSDLEGHPRADGLSTASVLRATRVALTAQAAADRHQFDVAVA